MKKKINRLFLLLIFSLSFIVFSSCNFQETENHTGLGYIRISFDEEEKSRTIKPRIDTSEITNIRLYGTKSGNLKMLLGEWENSSGMYSNISLVPGDWEISIELTYNHQRYQDTKTVRITEGEYSSVKFSLNSVYNTNGNLEVKIKFYSSVVNNATVKLYSYPSMEVKHTQNLEICNDDSEKYVQYFNYIDAGTYYLEIKFSSEDGVLNTYSDIVRIIGGLDSEEERYISINTTPL